MKVSSKSLTRNDQKILAEALRGSVKIKAIYEKLHPCPFCGCEKIHMTYVGPGDVSKFWGAYCQDCGASSKPVQSQMEASKLWNRRHQ